MKRFQSFSIAAFAFGATAMLIRLSVLASLPVGLIALVQAQDLQWRGVARAGLKEFVREQRGMLELPWPIAFYGDFTGDGQDDAIVFVYRDIEGAAGNFDLKVALFIGEGSTFKFLRYAPNIYGEQPRQPKFSHGVVELTTTMPRPGDPRCCPTGSKRYSIETGTSLALGTTVPRPGSSQPVSPAPSAAETSTGVARDPRPATDLVKRAYAHLSTKGLPPDKPYFTAGFFALVQKDRRCEQKIGDQRYASTIWFSGQDWKITDLTLSEKAVSEGERHVAASFKNMNDLQGRTFVLKRVGSEWRIDDVTIDGGTKLRRTLQISRCV